MLLPKFAFGFKIIKHPGVCRKISAMQTMAIVVKAA